MERDNNMRGNEDHHQLQHHQDHSRLLNPPPMMILQSSSSSDGQQGHQQQHQHQQQQQQQQVQQPQKCPRCDSMNTKFCYYNNYSLSQPRYFCKTCRRYWTQGGTLRNVPVGGGCRKGKRTKTSTATSSASSTSSSTSSGSEVITSSRAIPMIQQQPHLPQPPINLDSSLGLGPNLAPPPYYPIGRGSSSSSGGGVGGGSFLSSLAAMASLHQGLSGGGGGGYFSALSGGHDNINYPIVGGSYDSSQQQKQNLFSNRSDENRMNPTNLDISDSIGLWSGHVGGGIIGGGGGRGGGGGDSDSSGAVGSSLNPRQWPDLPGYGPPP